MELTERIYFYQYGDEDSLSMKLEIVKSLNGDYIYIKFVEENLSGRRNKRVTTRANIIETFMSETHHDVDIYTTTLKLSPMPNNPRPEEYFTIESI